MSVWETLLEVAFILVSVYVLFGAFLFIFQRQIMYHPDDQDFKECPGFDDAEKVDHDGTRMYYKNNSDKIIVYYHGNAGSACDRAFMKDKLEELDYSHIFVEYAGYSDDEALPKKERLLQDAENVNEFLQEKDYEETVILGMSLGSAVGTYHSTLSEPDKMLLIGPFHSISDVAKKHYPIYPVQWLVKDDYKTHEWLDGYSGNLLILHPSKDTVVPVESGKRLFESVQVDDSEFIELEGMGHNDVFFNEKSWSRIEGFLQS